MLTSTDWTKKFATTRYTYICCDIPGNKKINIENKKEIQPKNNRKIKIIKR